MFQITDENYTYYKQVFEIVWSFQATHLFNTDPYIQHSPLISLSNFEKHGKPLARKSLREGLRDCLAILIGLPENLKAELNAELEKKGLYSLYKLVALVSDMPKKVLKRGSVKNLDEYYVVKEFLLGLSPDLALHDQHRLETILGNFEVNH